MPVIEGRGDTLDELGDRALAGAFGQIASNVPRFGIELLLRRWRLSRPPQEEAGRLPFRQVSRPEAVSSTNWSGPSPRALA